MDEFQKAQILLHEYNALRAEILSRQTAQFQSGGATALVLLGLFTLLANRGFNLWIAGLVLLDLFLFLAAMIWVGRDNAKAAHRLREIEQRVNVLAGGPLLGPLVNASPNSTEDAPPDVIRAAPDAA